MLPPAAGALENPRSSGQLISQPPGAPCADEPVGPTQLRQCGDARRLIPIAIHEREKSGHHGAPTATLRRAQDTRPTRTYQEHVNLPCFNRRGRLDKTKTLVQIFAEQGAYSPRTEVEAN